MPNNRMQIQWGKLAASVVAIEFPQTGRPTLYRREVDPTRWPFYVKAAYTNKTNGAVLIKDDTEKGQKILLEESIASEDTDEDTVIKPRKTIRRAAKAKRAKKAAPKGRKAKVEEAAFADTEL